MPHPHLPDQWPPEGYEDWPGGFTKVGPDDREMRVIWPAWFQKPHVTKPNIPIIGDFDPKACDPDPDVWPHSTDPGTVDDVEELTLLLNSYPAPHVRWVTDEYMRQTAQGPTEVTDEMRRIARRELRGRNTNSGPPKVDGVELTNTRLEALRRIAGLWNGEEVRGNHILVDKLPSWDTILGDLDQDELERLSHDPTVDDKLVEAFGGMPWFDRQTIFCDSEYILRKRVDWAPTQDGRSLINAWDDLPDLRGDPNESLRHRVTVLLAAVWLDQQYDNVDTYHPAESEQFKEDYVVDVVGWNDDLETTCIEVETAHNNHDRRRETYAKLEDIDNNEPKVETAVASPTREAAYDVLNTWSKFSQSQEPDQFSTDARISWGREKVQEAYEETEWAIGDWYTTDWLWRHTLGRDGPDIDAEEITSQMW